MRQPIRLFEHPVITVRTLERDLEVSYATANNVLTRMLELGLIQESTEYEPVSRALAGSNSMPRLAKRTIFENPSGRCGGGLRPPRGAAPSSS